MQKNTNTNTNTISHRALLLACNCFKKLDFPLLALFSVPDFPKDFSRKSALVYLWLGKTSQPPPNFELFPTFLKAE